MDGMQCTLHVSISHSEGFREARSRGNWAKSSVQTGAGKVGRAGVGPVVIRAVKNRAGCEDLTLTGAQDVDQLSSSRNTNPNVPTSGIVIDDVTYCLVICILNSEYPC